jgi:tetratricopeptide (TPR) repeat protein
MTQKSILKLISEQLNITVDGIGAVTKSSILILLIIWLAEVGGVLSRNNYEQQAQKDRDECWSLGSSGQRILACTRFIKTYPSSPMAYLERAAAYRDGEDYDNALADYNKAIQLSPPSVKLYIARGEMFEKKGYFQSARSEYLASLEIPYTSLDEVHRNHAKERIAALEISAKTSNEASSKTQEFWSHTWKNYSTSYELEAVKNTSPQSTLSKHEHSSSTPTVIGRRIALVVGNSTYGHAPTLKNAGNDAKSIAAAFRHLGFADVTELHDLDLSAMATAIKSFGDKAADADWAVVYYSGHGVEAEGMNYLVPVDATLASRAHIEDETLPLSRLLAKAAPARQLRLVILDACRSNPFRMASATGETRSVGRGLARVEPGGGVLVAYAARDGAVAQDGASAHSPYTTALLQHLETPGLEINLLFRKVRDAVLKSTHNAQEPYTYGSLPGDALYFK